jgi:hypothetical protein
MVDTSPYGDATLRLRIAKGDATRTVQVVNGGWWMVDGYAQCWLSVYLATTLTNYSYY